MAKYVGTKVSLKKEKKVFLKFQFRGTYPGNEREDLSHGHPEKLCFLAWILHANHVKELQSLDGRITKIKSMNKSHKSSLICVTLQIKGKMKAENPTYENECIKVSNTGGPAKLRLK